jgi:hypothetical protein
MPLLRYFLFVGASLLALLLVANAALPSAATPEGLTSGTDLPPIRIRSERKLPERVVLDTSVATPAPVALLPASAKPQMAAVSPVIQAPLPPVVAQMSARARVREAFAQLPQDHDGLEPKKMSDMATVVVPEPKMYPARQPIKQRAAVAKPRYNAHPPMMVAQQPMQQPMMMQQPRGFINTW